MEMYYIVCIESQRSGEGVEAQIIKLGGSLLSLYQKDPSRRARAKSEAVLARLGRVR